MKLRQLRSIFLDTKSALQASLNMYVINSNRKVVNDVILLLKSDVRQGNNIICNFIPRNSGTCGNRIDNIALKKDPDSPVTTLLPFSRADAAPLIRKIELQIALSLCANHCYHYAKLHQINPKFNFEAPKSPLRGLETAFHRLRLNVVTPLRRYPLTSLRRYQQMHQS